MKTHTRFLFPAFLLAVSILNFSCKEKESGEGKKILPEVTTLRASAVTSVSAILGGEIVEIGTPACNEKGVCWSTTQNPTRDGARDYGSVDGAGAFTYWIPNLEPSTTYYVRAYAVNTAGDIVYGNQVDFTTGVADGTATVITTAAATSITASSAVLGGVVTAEGNPVHYERGVCCAMHENPSRGGYNVITLKAEEAGEGAFSATAEGLYPGSIYYARTYTVSLMGTLYGPQISFTSGASGTKATVTTAEVTGIEVNTAVMGGKVVNAGSPAYTEVGICYDYAPTVPSVNGRKVPVDMSGTGAFELPMDEIGYNTKIYVRAYAINTAGVAYGDQVEFWALPRDRVPEPATMEPRDVTSTGAFFLGVINGDYNLGSPAATDYGFCYATTPNPTLANLVVPTTASRSGFYASVNGLTPNTTYYVRAYARNRAGTGYGGQIYFSTLAATTASKPAAPSDLKAEPVSTTSYRLSWTNRATNAAEVRLQRYNGSAWVDHATMGPNATSYTATNLTAGTAYRYRVYAYNDSGDSPYSTEVTFTTATRAPEITTLIGVFNSVIISIGGQMTNTGSPAYTERGVCWGTSPNPTVDGNSRKITTPDSYMTTLRLESNTTYYVRAWVKGPAGLQYAEQKSFTTPQLPTTPAGFSADLFDATTVRLSWTDPVANTTVFFYESTDGVNWTQRGGVKNYGSGEISKGYVEGLDPGLHYFKVDRRLGNVDSEFTAVRQVLVPTPPELQTIVIPMPTGYNFSAYVVHAGSPAYAKLGFEWTAGESGWRDYTLSTDGKTGTFNVFAPISELPRNQWLRVKAYAWVGGVKYHGGVLDLYVK